MHSDRPFNASEFVWEEETGRWVRVRGASRAAMVDCNAAAATARRAGQAGASGAAGTMRRITDPRVPLPGDIRLGSAAAAGEGDGGDRDPAPRGRTAAEGGADGSSGEGEGDTTAGEAAPGSRGGAAAWLPSFSMLLVSAAAAALGVAGARAWRSTVRGQRLPVPATRSTPLPASFKALGASPLRTVATMLAAPLVAAAATMRRRAAAREARRVVGVLRARRLRLLGLTGAAGGSEGGDAQDAAPVDGFFDSTDCVLDGVAHWAMARTGKFPRLAARLPAVRLLHSSQPTPISPVPADVVRVIASGVAASADDGGAPGAAEGGAVSLPAVCVKRDEFTSPLYGGNKARKLELLLAEALCGGATRVLTLGPAGSHHCLATAVFAREVGLRAALQFVPQALTADTRDVLLADAAVGAQLRHYGSAPFRASDGVMTAAIIKGVAGTVATLVRYWFSEGRMPAVIPPGGSCPLGALGFVNAAFELAEQVQRGDLLRAPDRIYVALGTGGTSAGLLLGLAAAGLRHTRVVAVQVVGDSEQLRSRDAVKEEFEGARDLLRSFEPGIDTEQLQWREEALEVRDGFLGDGYARPTAEGDEAAALLAGCGVELESTYTAKAAAALVADIRAERLVGGQLALLWHTFSDTSCLRALAAPSVAKGGHAAVLPPEFARYFDDRAWEGAARLDCA